MRHLKSQTRVPLNPMVYHQYFLSRFSIQAAIWVMPGLRLLDLGCGVGALLARLRR